MLGDNNCSVVLNYALLAVSGGRAAAGGQRPVPNHGVGRLRAEREFFEYVRCVESGSSMVTASAGEREG